MSTTLTLEIPEHIYRPLQKKASKQGKTPDQIIIEWLSNAIKNDVDDPLLQLAGIFSSDIKDIGTKHDTFIGRELSDSHE